jgi:hypothetical protein
MDDHPINVRSDTHGPFTENARIAQAAKEIWRGSPNWPKLSEFQREVLDLMTIKIARMLSGDHNCEEHWVDMAGYPMLVARALAEIRLESGSIPPSDAVRSVGHKGKRGVKLADDKEARVGDHVVFRGSGAIGIIRSLECGAGQIEVEWLGKPDDRLIRSNRNRVSWRDLQKGYPE